MLPEYLNNWLLFAIFFGLMLLLTFIMMLQSRQFYTKDVIVRKFSIMELEVPASPKELVHIIKGLSLLPAPQSQKTIAALKAQLKLDFLFMPLVYGSVFFLCWRVAIKMNLHFGHYVFLGFALLQLVPWICDIIENIYLLNKINQGAQVTETTDKKHTAYLYMEAFKWGIVLTATACALSAVCYFWLTGSYSATSFNYMLIVLAEIAVFAFIVKRAAKKNVA
ncbi:hypothetical protein BH11BAC6_BH11BAC6_01390 [soil metagenome]